MNIIGKRLHNCGTEERLTQARLAQKLFNTQNTMVMYERGELQPNLETLLQICKILNVSAVYLLSLGD